MGHGELVDDASEGLLGARHVTEVAEVQATEAGEQLDPLVLGAFDLDPTGQDLGQPLPGQGDLVDAIEGAEYLGVVAVDLQQVLPHLLRPLGVADLLLVDMGELPAGAELDVAGFDGGQDLGIGPGQLLPALGQDGREAVELLGRALVLGREQQSAGQPGEGRLDAAEAVLVDVGEVVDDFQLLAGLGEEVDLGLQQPGQALPLLARLVDRLEDAGDLHLVGALGVDQLEGGAGCGVQRIDVEDLAAGGDGARQVLDLLVQDLSAIELEGEGLFFALRDSLLAAEDLDQLGPSAGGAIHAVQAAQGGGLLGVLLEHAAQARDGLGQFGGFFLVDAGGAQAEQDLDLGFLGRGEALVVEGGQLEPGVEHGGEPLEGFEGVVVDRIDAEGLGEGAEGILGLVEPVGSFVQLGDEMQELDAPEGIFGVRDFHFVGRDQLAPLGRTLVQRSEDGGGGEGLLAGGHEGLEGLDRRLVIGAGVEDAAVELDGPGGPRRASAPRCGPRGSGRRGRRWDRWRPRTRARGCAGARAKPRLPRRARRAGRWREGRWDPARGCACRYRWRAAGP